MDASLPLLKDMSQGKSISPTALDILKLKRYFERIALIVDVCTSNEQISEDRRQKPEYQQAVRYRQEPPILSFAERVAWLNGAPLQDSFVSLGSHDGVLGLNPDFTITYYLRVCKGDTKPVRRVKRVSLAINNIIACLEVGAKDDDMPPSLRPIDEVSSWPIVPTVSYDDYFSLRTQNPDTVAKRTLLQNNLYVAETERLTRLHGAFTLPGTQGGA
jgi:hypothetical protein